MAVINFGNSSQNLNYPLSRPTLDLNFAASKLLDPRITFSRSSTGTYVGADGVIKSAAVNAARFDHNPTTGESLGLLVEEARTNSRTYSEYFNLGNWTLTSPGSYILPNSVRAPNNTLTAQKLVTSNGTGQQRIVASDLSVPAGTYTLSVYAKAAGFSFMRLEHGADITIVNFDLAQGVLGTNTGAGSITNMGNGWYKCSMQIVTSVALSDIRIYVIGSATDARGSTLSGNGVDGIYIWGVQLELGSFPTSYIPTPASFTSRASTATYYDSAGVIQTAATNVARSAAYFPDSNGVMQSAGLLLEAAGTNLATYSGEFDNAAWGKFDTTVSANATTAPDGTSTADKLVASATTAVHYLDPGTAPNTVANTTYTFSVFAKAAEYSSIVIENNFGGVYANAAFNLSTESVTTASNSGTVFSSTMQKLANGWWRLTLVSSITMNGYTVIYPNQKASFTGNGTSGIYIWGAQLETGSYPTSYIPTVASTVTRSADVSSSATVTRSADVASITGTNFSGWYNQDQGVVFSTAKIPPFSSNTVNSPYLARLGTSNNINNSITFYVSNNGNQEVSAIQATGIGHGDIAAGTLIKNAIGYTKAAGTVSASLNGSIGTSSSVTTSIPIYDVLDIGKVNTDGRYYWNSTIARITYYPVRLSDATLQALTQ